MLDFFEFSAVEDTAVLARYDIVFVRRGCIVVLGNKTLGG